MSYFARTSFVTLMAATCIAAGAGAQQLQPVSFDPSSAQPVVGLAEQMQGADGNYYRLVPYYGPVTDDTQIDGYLIGGPVPAPAGRSAPPEIVTRPSIQVAQVRQAEFQETDFIPAPRPAQVATPQFDIPLFSQPNYVQVIGQQPVYYPPQLAQPQLQYQFIQQPAAQAIVPVAATAPVTAPVSLAIPQAPSASAVAVAGATAVAAPAPAAQGVIAPAPRPASVVSVPAAPAIPKAPAAPAAARAKPAAQQVVYRSAAQTPIINNNYNNISINIDGLSRGKSAYPMMAFAVKPVNMRKCGKVSCKRIGTLKKNEQIRLDGCNKNWCRGTTTRGKKCWVSRKYLGIRKARK